MRQQVNSLVAGSSPRVRGTRIRRRLGEERDRFIPACAGNSSRSSRRPDRPSVHPRVCGELANPRHARTLYAGSSPRVRGTPVIGGVAGRRRRFIPACAGNSRGSASIPRRSSVHPRVCGELRGLEGDSGPDRRFIPACAGNSLRHQACASATAVHPRVCGELGNDLVVMVAAAGSSPRVRGTRISRLRRPESRRFIPACAGNSRRRRCARRPPTVHPRVCGELLQEAAAACGAAGSSPRVRGTPLGRLGDRQARRFIPACAGNSRSAWWTRPGTSVHPRVCGELYAGFHDAMNSAGSSPRVRGTRSQSPSATCSTTVHPRVCGELGVDGDGEVPPSGSSPRVRGTPPSCRCRRGPGPVHPRVCGELADLLVDARIDYGSSPRVRGTRSASRASPGSRRFIPACAGNSASRWTTVTVSPVHPRVCGELCRTSTAVVTASGSSPRVRGTLMLYVAVAGLLVGSSPRVRGTRRGRGRRCPGRRFIPACAGNSSSWSIAVSRRPVHPRVCGELTADHV